MNNLTNSDNLPATNIPLEEFQKEFESFEEAFTALGQSDMAISSKIGKNLIDNLPPLLRTGCQRLSNPSEQEVFLMGAIGVLSGTLPNIHGLYHGRYVCPNLFIFIVAKFGTGKGFLHFAKMLGQPIHEAKKAAAEQERDEFNELLGQYEKDYTAYQKDKTGQRSIPVKPFQPNQQLLFIPANNSKSGFFELLNSNNGKGIIFETEADTVCDAMRQEYGDYSDGLRRAFQHEPISFYRRAGKEFIEIASPELSVILSGTSGQLFRLFPSIENGLLSRFIFFELVGTGEFNDPFDNSKADYLEFFQSLSSSVFDLYERLSRLNKPIEFKLSSEQQAKFVHLFQQWKTEIREYVSDDLDGSVNRLGLICFRLTMIFTVLRVFERNEPFNRVVICEDMDFENAIALTAIIKHQTLKIYYMMPETNKPKPLIQHENEALIRIAKEKKALGMSFRKIALELRVSHSKVYRWVNDL